MVKPKNLIFVLLIIIFLLFSFSPTIFELSQSNNLTDKSREFILEHNYYWPDYNLYLSKIRQGFEGHLTAKELYTSEVHKGSLIQEFYVILGLLGRFLKLNPNYSYLLGRIILSPLLLLLILKFVSYYFANQHRVLNSLKPKDYIWQLLAFLIIIVSGSFPRLWFDQNGALQIGRYMEWWSNIDALQRLTFIPHILFGQIVSFYLLYHLTLNIKHLTRKKLILLIFLGNLTGIVFPPSLITLNGTLLLILTLAVFKKLKSYSYIFNFRSETKYISMGLFIILTLPSLIYLLLLTKQIPWSALIDFHRTHPMTIPLDQYILGTGPIIFLSFFGALISIIKKEKKYQPLILWLVVTFLLASFFSMVREQSPLRFTQTGVFIPLGILGAYFFYQLFHLSYLSHLGHLGRRLLKTGVLTLIGLYLLSNLLMMKVSYDWQIGWIGQLIGATYPAVPYPPQTVLPLKDWMVGLRWLRDNTNHDDVVLAEITAGNYIPAYSGNYVYFGQANTYDFENKKILVDKFFKEEFEPGQAEIFIKNGRIKYVFESYQEKEQAGDKNLSRAYPFLKPVFSNSIVTIYRVEN